jgi:hypothetical protein
VGLAEVLPLNGLKWISADEVVEDRVMVDTLFWVLSGVSGSDGEAIGDNEPSLTSCSIGTVEGVGMGSATAAVIMLCRSAKYSHNLGSHEVY